MTTVWRILGLLIFFSALSTDTFNGLAAATELVRLVAGEALFRQGDSAVAVYLLVSGEMQVMPESDGEEDVHLGTIKQGDIVGEISVLFGGSRTATVRAVRKCVLLKIPKENIDRVVRESPGIIDELARLSHRRLRRNQLLTILPTILTTIDEAALRDIEAQLEWIELEREDILFHNGESSDSIYVIVNGRLRAYVETDSGERKILGEMVKGEIVGEIGLFTREPRNATVYAVRNSTLVRMGRSEFEGLIKQYPEVMMSLTKGLIARLKSSIAEQSPDSGVNIAVVSAQQNVPMAGFTRQFAEALKKCGETLHLSSEKFDGLVGISGASEKLKPSDPYCTRLNAWLDEQEANHKFLIFEGENKPSAWSTRCIQQADIIMIVANVRERVQLGEMANDLTRSKSSPFAARQMLVLLHDDSDRLPIETGKWLSLTSAERHCHIRSGRTADFERLARIVTGKGIGLVLGGGGARGFAHIGVIRALQESGVPIDMVGGTSMGAIISAQHAMGWSYDEMLRQNRRAWVEMKPHKEFTLPVIALTRGIRGEEVGEMLYGERKIEDLWTNYFCISCSLTKAEAVIHGRGLLRKAVMASSALPGIAVPVIDAGNVLVDGGLLNNLPADVMKDKCGGEVIAVDVGSELRLTADFQEFPSPWKIASSTMLPFQQPIQSLNIFHLLLGATFVGGANKVDQLKKYADYYLRPPIDKFSLLDLDKLEEIAEVGYEYSKDQVRDWIQNKRLGRFL